MAAQGQKNIYRAPRKYRRLYDEAGNCKPNAGTKPLRCESDSKPRGQFLAENPEAVIPEGA
ncbi:MAG: hypothetical protein WBD16_06495 [Pyrinomonadaceae bacterium]